MVSRFTRCLVVFALLLGAVPATSAPTTVSDVFDALKKVTISHSPEIQLAESAYRQSSAQVQTAWAHWLPRADIQLSQNTSKDYSFINSGTLPPPFTSFTPSEVQLSGWAVKLSLPLYRRSVHLAVEQSVRDRRLSSYQLDSKKAELDWRLRSLLGAYLLQVYKEATLIHSIEAAGTNERESKARYELGQRTRVDVLRAEANRVSLESRKLTYEQERTAGLDSLIQYSGSSREELAKSGLFDLLVDEKELEIAIADFTEGSDKWLDQLSSYLKPSEQGTDETIQSDLLRRRVVEASPVYQSFLAQEALSETKAALLMAQDWPELSLQGSLSRQAGNFSDLFSQANQSYAFGAVLTIPVYLGGSLFSSHSEKVNAEAAARVSRERDTLNLFSDVESEVRQIRALRRSVESLTLNRQQNEEIVRLSLKSYQLGKATIVELLGSQNDLIESKINLAKAKLDLAVLLKRLGANLGVSL